MAFPAITLSIVGVILNETVLAASSPWTQIEISATNYYKTEMPHKTKQLLSNTG